ncbi:MAG: type II secretion system protein GspK [Myxococcota bacterium]|nr:type II secretion system protein GspK [Myxococcota bacterium]
MRNKRGVALLMVLATVAVMTTVVMEFVHDTQVRSRIAANARDSVRAYFLARSGMELSRLMIAFMKQSPCPVSSGLAGALTQASGAKDITKGGTSGGGTSCEDELRVLQQMLNMPPQPFWKMLPITSELFQGVADGSFGAMMGIPAPALVTGIEQSDEGGKLADVDEGSGVLFGNLPGNFSVEIDDEDRKIPLKSLWKGTPAQNRAAMMRLAALIAPPRYDALFSGVNSRGEEVDRHEFLSAILDWMDPDTSISEIDLMSGQRVTGSAPEDSRYDSEEAPYRSRNASFDSIAELRLVKGFSDEAYRAFADHLSIYSEDKVNIESMLAGLLGRQLPNDQGELTAMSAPAQFLAGLSVCLKPEQLVQVWQRLGLWYTAFNNCVLIGLLPEEAQAEVLCPLDNIPAVNPFSNFFVETLAQLASAEGITLDKKVCEDAITVTSRYFKITSHARVGDARRTLTMVIRHAPTDAREERYYWREE